MQRTRSVKNLLMEMKTKVSQMLDLAYAAVLTQAPDLAEYVIDQRDKLISMFRELIYHAILAGRDPETARASVGLIEIARSLLDIANACADIAKCALEHLTSREFEEVMRRSEMSVQVLVVPRTSKIVGRPISSLEREGIFVDVLLIKRRGRWIISPSPSETFAPEDVIVVRGRPEHVRALAELVSAG